MSRGSSIIETTDRLLDVKRGLGHDLPARPIPDEPQPAPSGTSTTACVYCGYSQQGTRFNRCPECGLLFAAQMSDPTEWSSGPVALGTWLRTAQQVWTWNRRTRVRTAIIPGSPESKAFARWSMMLSAPLLGLAVAFLRWRSGVSQAYGLGYATVETVLGGVGALLVMLAGQHALRLTLRGRWRRHLNVVPACIDYATAWWPIVAMVALWCAIAYLSAGPASLIPLLVLMTGAVMVWAGWLWTSIGESQNVRFVALRVAVLGLCLAVGGHWLTVALLGTASMVVKQLTAVAAPARAGITCAVVLDVTSEYPDPLVIARLKAMGLRPENFVALAGKQATVEALKQALAASRAKLWSQDRFVLYINCRGASESPGTMRLKDDKLDSDTLARLLSASPTDNNLIVIESESGDAFLPSLKPNVRGVVVTCPDVPEFRYNSGLRDFWETLGEAESDKNKDGQITVDEAFDAAYEQMLKSLAAERKKRDRLGRPKTTLNPELTVLGKADPGVFRTRTPPPDNAKPDPSAPATSTPPPVITPPVPPASKWDWPARSPTRRPLQ